jgi:hypothetical protein
MRGCFPHCGQSQAYFCLGWVALLPATVLWKTDFRSRRPELNDANAVRDLKDIAVVLIRKGLYAAIVLLAAGARLLLCCPV